MRASFRGLLTGVQHAEDSSFIEEQFLDSTQQLLELCAERRPPSRPSGSHPAISKVRARLHDEFAEPLSLEQLALDVGLSKFHVARCFKEATGVAPHQYQKLLRLQSARRHIERGVCVREAAAACGFSDEAHLSRTFRDWLGVSPGIWRRPTARRKVTSIPAHGVGDAPGATRAGPALRAQSRGPDRARPREATQGLEADLQARVMGEFWLLGPERRFAGWKQRGCGEYQRGSERER